MAAAQNPQTGRNPRFDSVEDEWRAYLEGEHPDPVRMRRLFSRLPHGPRCKLCAAPFGGIGGFVVRRFGFRPWDRNPNLCGRCLLRLSDRRLTGAEVNLSLLFADVRGSTSIAEGLEPSDFRGLMNRFYQVATETLIDHDALVDQFVGDEVIGLFTRGLAGPDHASRAVSAAKDLLRRTGNVEGQKPWLPLGAGVHTGVAYVGVVGTAGSVSQFTALGDAVNTTARLASLAGAGEILVTSAALAAGQQLSADPMLADVERRRLTVRGRTEEVDVAVVRAS